jgi:hypothetical protein
MTNAKPTSYQWTIPGYAISNYVVKADSSSGIVYSNFPTANSNAFFYWVEGANNHVVECSVTVGGQKAVGKAILNVVRPSIDLTTQTGTVAVNDNYAVRIGSVVVTNVFALHYGNPMGTPGIRFSLSNGSTPAGFEVNAGAWVQLVDSLLNQIQTTNGVWQTVGQVTNSVLDVTFPYSGGFQPDDISDSPGQPAVPPSNYLGISVTNSFSMYLMVKPTAAGNVPITNGCYVPLRVVSWRWSATAFLSGTNWVLTNNYNNPNPTGSDSTLYPQWTDNVTNHLFQTP